MAEATRRPILRATSGQVSAGARALAEEVKSSAFAVIPSFWNVDRCADVRGEIDRLCRMDGEPSGRWVDAVGSDHRFFRAERHAPLLRGFLDDPLIEEVRRAHTGRPKADKFVLAARLEHREGNLGSGGGWHMDSPHSRQFKAILYLSDVGERNGPFEVVPRTHRHSALLRLLLKGLRKPSQYRFSNGEMEAIFRSEGAPHAFTGKAGTLILVDVTALHRGAPILEGSRYALTLYCGDPHLSEDGH
jgi:hypothetical protein